MCEFQFFCCAFSVRDFILYNSLTGSLFFFYCVKISWQHVNTAVTTSCRHCRHSFIRFCPCPSLTICVHVTLRDKKTLEKVFRPKDCVTNLTLVCQKWAYRPSSIVHRPSSIVYRPESSVWVLAHARKNGYNQRYFKNTEQYILGVARGASSEVLSLIK